MYLMLIYLFCQIHYYEPELEVLVNIRKTVEKEKIVALKRKALLEDT
jgi:hypothetical protein